MEDYYSPAATFEGAPSLFSGSSNPSDRNALPTPSTFMGNVCATREGIFSNPKNVEQSLSLQSREAHPIQFSKDLWSDFLVQDYLSCSEPEPIGKLSPEDSFDTWNDSLQTLVPSGDDQDVKMDYTDLGDVCVDKPEGGFYRNSDGEKRALQATIPDG